MKKLLLLTCAMIIALSASAQQVPTYQIDNGAIVVTKIVENIPADAAGIYSRANSYFTRAYGDANSVIQTDDKAGGVIIGKGLYGALLRYGMGGMLDTEKNDW